MQCFSSLDPTPFMIGSIATLLIGILLGVAIVGGCWYRAVNGPIERKAAKTRERYQAYEKELVEEATDLVRSIRRKNEDDSTKVSSNVNHS
jgi:hypothetical protein